MVNERKFVERNPFRPITSYIELSKLKAKQIISDKRPKNKPKCGNYEKYANIGGTPNYVGGKRNLEQIAKTMENPGVIGYKLEMKGTIFIFILFIRIHDWF